MFSKSWPILLIFTLICSNSTLAQVTTDKKLESSIRELTESFHGDVGIYIQNLKTGATVEINADTIYPTASIVKIPILLGIFDK
ncbi:serine hydrolase [Algoriphagus aquimarinus]|uniref:serine hydrolase n=1 Tax=Algoriphagus aquimarinus TaxID=237018 RepID=UPI0030DC8BCC|tara:strand:- start:408 stop:659 length:252 start_codon:yes stop_codon:yes gene_type:complete